METHGTFFKCEWFTSKENNSFRKKRIDAPELGSSGCAS